MWPFSNSKIQWNPLHKTHFNPHTNSVFLHPCNQTFPSVAADTFGVYELDFGLFLHCMLPQVDTLKLDTLKFEITVCHHEFTPVSVCVCLSVCLFLSHTCTYTHLVTFEKTTCIAKHQAKGCLLTRASSVCIPDCLEATGSLHSTDYLWHALAPTRLSS